MKVIEIKEINQYIIIKLFLKNNIVYAIFIIIFLSLYTISIVFFNHIYIRNISLLLLLYLLLFYYVLF